jgi:hypothetical protein
MTKELWALGALDLAERIAAKEISSREVTAYTWPGSRR